MSPQQDRLYWREWSRVRFTCRQHGWPLPDRHELHVRALGHDLSHLAFGNEDLDKVMAEFRAISRPEDLAGQLRQQDQPRRRLQYSILHLAPEPYWQAIAADKFGTADLDRLTVEQLMQLRMTLGARARSRQRRETAAN